MEEILVKQGKKLIDDCWNLEQHYLKIQKGLEQLPKDKKDNPKYAVKSVAKIIKLNHSKWYQIFAHSYFVGDSIFGMLSESFFTRISLKKAKQLFKSAQQRQIINQFIKLTHLSYVYTYQDKKNKYRLITPQDVLNYFFNFLQEISNTQDNIEDIDLNAPDYFGSDFSKSGEQKSEHEYLKAHDINKLKNYINNDIKDIAIIRNPEVDKELADVLNLF